ncbi:MAG: prenyltransferase [SAR324 cluster bacterium]|nr:prenyltransferase [SAR324 cluster bacterium]
MKTLFIWLKASRLASQSYIFLPLLLGQSIAWSQTGIWDWKVFALVQLFGLFDQFYIVYANDYADYATDRLNQTYTIFSGGSRVLADQDMPPEHLKIAACVMAFLSLGCGVALGVFAGRWGTVPLIGGGLLLLWMYSYPPVRLSYRGGGEWLQMLGVGVILPLVGYYAQTGEWRFPMEWMLVILPTQLACSISTSLPDEPSDQLSGKKTVPVTRGALTAKIMILGLHSLSSISWIVLTWNWTGMTMFQILLVPLTSMLISLFWIKARPGDKGMTVFVFFQILCTLSWMAGITAIHFYGWR